MAGFSPLSSPRIIIPEIITESAGVSPRGTEEVVTEIEPEFLVDSTIEGATTSVEAKPNEVLFIENDKQPFETGDEPPRQIMNHKLSDLEVDKRGALAKLEISLCGHLLYGLAEHRQHDEDVFMGNLVSWPTMNKEPGLWFNPSLVFRFENEDRYIPAKVALPLLASWIIYNKSLSEEAFKMLVRGQLKFMDADNPMTRLQIKTQDVLGEQPIPDAAVCLRRSRSLSPNKLPKRIGIMRASVTPSLCCGSTNTVEKTTELIVPSTELLLDSISRPKKYRKSLKPSSEQLSALNLKPGPNPITFSVTSALQGTKTVTGTIYLWPRNAKVVVSDVDGTITRSDVWGQLMPIVGRDWSHPGVAELFSNIRRSDYKILYLTARAIGQADSTRDYLFGLTQNVRNKLPGNSNTYSLIVTDGPLILSPDRLFPSFKREVIDRKPYVFKIAALRDIRSLFPSFYNPFYAGFGNRDTVRVFCSESPPLRTTELMFMSESRKLGSL